MANVKITELPSLSGANSVSTDLIPVVDVSADITSSMTRGEFFTNIPSINVVGDASTISAASSSTALTITQTGAGNALVVEDSTSPDSTPFVVTGAGNVGIGTNSPSTKLAVSGGALRIDAGDAVEDALVIGAGTTGTTGEIRSVKIFANLSTSKGIQLRADNAIQRIVALNSAGIGQLTFGNSSDGGTTFNERMRIDSAGNVGIGTAAPAAQLHVSGNTTAIATINVGASITGTTLNVVSVVLNTIAVGDRLYGVGVSPITRIVSQIDGTTGGAGNYVVSVSQTVPSGQQMFTNSGAAATIRITDTDTTSLTGQPSGTIEFFGSDINTPTAGVGAYISAVSESSTPDTALVFGTRDNVGVGVDANERMRITSLGNVGIGTTAPVTPLHVVGASITTGIAFRNQSTETSKSAAVTLTIAELLTRIVQFTGSTIGTLTLPTGTAIEGGLPAVFPVDMSFEFSVINTGTAAGAVTITTNTGLTLVGSMLVPITTSGLFRVRKTATNNYTVYRIC